MFINPYLCKSKEYQTAINILKADTSKTNNVKVHSAYYMCLFYEKYLVSKYLVADDRWDNFYSSVKNTVKGKGSHELFFIIFKNLLRRNKIKKSLYMDIDSSMYLLKTGRVKASYEQAPFDKEEFDIFFEGVDSTISKLKSVEHFLQEKKDKNRLQRVDNFVKIGKNKWSCTTNPKHIFHLAIEDEKSK